MEARLRMTPPPACDHARDDGLRAEEDALYVDLVDAVEIGLGGGLDGADVGDAGVVDQDIDAAGGIGDALDGGLDRCGIGDVAAEGFGGPRTGVAGGRYGLGGVRRGGFIEIESEDARALGGEGVGDRAADAGAGAGDDGGLSVEAIHGSGMVVGRGRGGKWVRGSPQRRRGRREGRGMLAAIWRWCCGGGGGSEKNPSPELRMTTLRVGDRDFGGRACGCCMREKSWCFGRAGVAADRCRA